MSVHEVTLTKPCTHCQHTDGLFEDSITARGIKGQARFLLSCENCGRVVVASDDMLAVASMFLIGRAKAGTAVTKLPPPPAPPKNTKAPPPTTTQILKSFRTGSFGKPAPGPGNLIRSQIGRLPKATSEHKKQWRSMFLIGRAKAGKKQWRMKDAYEANKKANVCVVCQKPMAMHPSVGVLYCKCIESLPV